MTPPLTRETLAELRRLQTVAALALRRYEQHRELGWKTAGAFDAWKAAESHFADAMMADATALLAAAERGLDAEGGR